MIKMTQAAIDQLKAVMLEHQEDPIVRMTIRDLNEAQLQYSIILEDKAQPDDEVQEIDGLTVAVEGQSVPRVDGVTVDFDAIKGFTFIHPESGHRHGEEEDPFDFSSLHLN
ncbi:MAG TPA: hypothetical protein EYN18_00670 [Nitrospirales bacterium]|nr:hypothetical protein [Nitrospirales bacterium]HIO20900.1 hypothetical protein [Nitrospirales bacterium]